MALLGPDTSAWAPEVRILADDALLLAWARCRPGPPQQLIAVDAVLPFLADRDAVAVLDWVHSGLSTGA